VDEYIYLPDGRSLEAVLDELSPYTQFTIEQNPMSSKLCVLDPKENHAKYVSTLSLSSFIKLFYVILVDWKSL
jgi:hypothetical protein